MEPTLKLLDVVALTEDFPARGLLRGQVGTIVEILDDRHFEVEFADVQGRTYALLAVPASRLMALHHEPVEAG